MENKGSKDFIYNLKTIQEIRGIWDNCGVEKKHLPTLPTRGQSIVECPQHLVGVHVDIFAKSNFRLPISNFFKEVLVHYGLHISQITPNGVLRITTFEMMCIAKGITPYLGLFRYFFSLRQHGEVYTLRTALGSPFLIQGMVVLNPKWKDRYFFVDRSLFPDTMRWRNERIVDDPNLPKGSYDLNDALVLSKHRVPARSYPEAILVIAGLRKNWIMDAKEMIPIKDNKEVDLMTYMEAEDDRVLSLKSRCENGNGTFEQPRKRCKLRSSEDVMDFDLASDPVGIKGNTNTESTPAEIPVSDEGNDAESTFTPEGIVDLPSMLHLEKTNAESDTILHKAENEELRLKKSQVDAELAKLLIQNAKLVIESTKLKKDLTSHLDENEQLRKADKEVKVALMNSLSDKDKEISCLHDRIRKMEEDAIRQKLEHHKALTGVQDSHVRLMNTIEFHQKEESKLTKEINELKETTNKLATECQTLKEDRSWILTHGVKSILYNLMGASEFTDKLALVLDKTVLLGCDKGCREMRDKYAIYAADESLPYFNPRIKEDVNDAYAEFRNSEFPYLEELAQCHQQPLEEIQSLRPKKG